MLEQRNTLHIAGCDPCHADQHLGRSSIQPDKFLDTFVVRIPLEPASAPAVHWHAELRLSIGVPLLHPAGAVDMCLPLLRIHLEEHDGASLAVKLADVRRERRRTHGRLR